MKDRTPLPGKIISPELCEKINKHLIIGRVVHLVDHQHDRLPRLSAYPAQHSEQCPHASAFRTFCKLRQLLCQFPLPRRTLLKRINKLFREGTDKDLCIYKLLTADALKIHQNHDILFLQIFRQRHQRRRLAVLASPVDDKIFPPGYELLPDHLQPPVEMDHVVLIRPAASLCIEIAHHLLCPFLIFSSIS